MNKRAEVRDLTFRAMQGTGRSHSTSSCSTRTIPDWLNLGFPGRPLQFDLLKALWEEMAVEEVAMSIAYSGY